MPSIRFKDQIHSGAMSKCLTVTDARKRDSPEEQAVRVRFSLVGPFGQLDMEASWPGLGFNVAIDSP